MDPDPVVDILHRFDSLPSPLSRRAVYLNLLDKLNLHEWRDVRERASQVTLQRDILGDLPPEVAAQIAVYFDLSDLYVFQRVSRRWLNLMTSGVIRSAVFERCTGRRCDLSTAESFVFSKLAKRRLLLERGRPVSKTQSPHVPRPARLHTLEYSSGRYAWIEDASYVAAVYSLRLNSTQRFCTENRDYFVKLRLSESIVAATTFHGYCHVWSLDSDDSAYFRLPSTTDDLFIVRKDYVALGFPDHQHRASGSVLLWDFRTRTGLSTQYAGNLLFMDVVPSTESLLTIYYEEKENDRPAQLRVVKHEFNTTAGNNSQYTVSLSHLGLPAIVNQPWSAMKCVCLNRTSFITASVLSPGQDTLSIQDAQSVAQGGIALTYDSHTDRVDVHAFRSDDMPFNVSCVTYADSGLLYFIKNDSGRPTICISNPNLTMPHRPSELMDTQLPRDANSRIYSYATRLFLQGDSEFMIMEDENGIKVWCFDETTKLPGGVAIQR